MNQWREEMKARTHRFVVDTVNLVKTLPDRIENRRLKDQLVGAACGIDGNWRAKCRARTHKEFTAKLGTVVDEANQAEEWLDAMHDAKLSDASELKRLRGESKELRAIFVRASRTANDNEKNNKRRGKPDQ